ncbi:MAG: hypothetical protein R6X34_23430 [Chloroflexota bacterium]
MNFLDAAYQIVKETGKPLHYTEIQSTCPGSTAYHPQRLDTGSYDGFAPLCRRQKA